MSKRAEVDHPIHEAITNRWSPYAFSNQPISRENLLSLFEAARWSASSYNEQPWTYIVATKDEPEEYERVLSCLVEQNQVWAKHAPVLGLGITSLKFSRNGKPNRVAEHDLGAASATLTFEATVRGLYVHQMAGINPDHARALYNVPEDHKIVTGLAIGHLGDPNSLPEELRSRDIETRPRKPLAEFVFGGEWGKSAGFVS